MSREQSHGALEYEMAREKAGALTRTMSRLEAALEALRSLPLTAAAELRTRLAEEAGEWLWFVVVQREAMGLTKHEDLYELCGVPAEVRVRMGPRRR